MYTTGTNGRDIPIWMKLCYEFWAYCVNGTNQMLTVTAASNANPINITTSSPHGLITNQFIGVYGVVGNTAANGGWTVTVTSPTTFNLNGAAGNGAYLSGGTIMVPGGLPISPTSAPAGFFEGSSVLALGNDGVTSAIGNTLTAASSTPFNSTMINKHVVVWLPGASTGIAPASAGLSLPQSTINVGNTLAFPLNGGTIFVTSSTGVQTVTYGLVPNTTVAAGSNGAILPQSTINTISTTGFPSSGTLNIVTSTGNQVVTYTSTTSTSFTGCSGGTGTLTTGNLVTAPQFTGCTGGTGVLSANGSVTSNQPSTDDSIYRILSVPSGNQLQIIPFSGGTPDISTLKNNITSRAALNYRVIDVIAASQLAVASGNYFIGNLLGAPNINSGQAVSQFQFLLRGTANTFGQIGMVASPNGSWSGSAFSGTGSNAPMTERNNANNLNYTGTTSAANGFATMVADTDFFFSQVCDTTNSNGAANAKGMYFLVTTPQRLYTQAQDPNLIAVLVGGNGLNTSNGTDSFSNSFGMVGFDGVTRSHQLISRNLVGDTANASVGTTYTVGFDLDSRLAFQGKSSQILMGEALMSVSSALGQFSFARARMRPVRFTSSSLPQYYLIGNSGEFIHLANGLLLPWDGSILPYPALPGGA